ncbi:MAG: cell division protein FtsA [Patescibacteria group bacterium]|nr:cell division protein FtsA [Patescibacteria group bacterium]
MIKQNVVVGLDVGTSKVAVCAGALSEGGIEVIGLAKAPNTGLRRGIVSDIEETVSAISAALEEAERMAGVPLSSCYVGIGGSQITSHNSKGVIAISRADGEITEADVERVIETSKTVAIPPNREILHIIPQHYIVDGQESIKDPIGMSGIRLEVETHVISGSISAIKNLTKCVTQAGLDVNGLVFSPLATSKITLSKKQMEMGVILIDIGAGTTSFAVFEEGDIIHCNVLPVGSMHITNDIAIGLRISLDAAEKIKIKHGTSASEKIRETETINLNNFDPQEDQKVSKKYVAEIIEARLTEIFSMIKDELKKINRDGMLPAGAIITGGGSQLTGLLEFCKEYLRLPARHGLPALEVSGMVDKIDDPVYATSVGLMLWGLEDTPKVSSKFKMPQMGGLVDRAKNIFKQFLP